jgi:hypothetical protein
MTRSIRNKLPTKSQTIWLRRIALSPLMVTRTPEFNDRYSLANGLTVPERTAKILIDRGWVVAERDGMWSDAPQTYRVRTPM